MQSIITPFCKQQAIIFKRLGKIIAIFRSFLIDMREPQKATHQQPKGDGFRFSDEPNQRRGKDDIGHRHPLRRKTNWKHCKENED